MSRTRPGRRGVLYAGGRVGRAGIMPDWTKPVYLCITESERFPQLPRRGPLSRHANACYAGAPIAIDARKSAARQRSGA